MCSLLVWNLALWQGFYTSQCHHLQQKSHPLSLQYFGCTWHPWHSYLAGDASMILLKWLKLNICCVPIVGNIHVDKSEFSPCITLFARWYLELSPFLRRCLPSVVGRYVSNTAIARRYSSAIRLHQAKTLRNALLVPQLRPQTRREQGYDSQLCVTNCWINSHGVIL